MYKDRAVTQDLVKRAQKAGYKALAVTVDTPILGRREADIRNKFALPSHLTMGNFAKAGGAHASGTKAAGSSGSGLASYVASLIDRTLTWDDIAWLRTITTMKVRLPSIPFIFAPFPCPFSDAALTTPSPRPPASPVQIVVKGVLGVEDALAAVKHGVDGIWVRAVSVSPPPPRPFRNPEPSSHLSCFPFASRLVPCGRRCPTTARGSWTRRPPPSRC